MSKQRFEEQWFEKQWFEKLTKAELVHLIDSVSIRTQNQILADLERNLNAQAVGLSPRCWHCQKIAKKVGITAVN